jgi:hypothetical protein
MIFILLAISAESFLVIKFRKFTLLSKKNIFSRVILLWPIGHWAMARPCSQLIDHGCKSLPRTNIATYFATQAEPKKKGLQH